MIEWLLIPLGVVIIIYADKVGNFIGEIPFAEKFWGGGGTYTFIKLFGLALSILSFMWGIGALQGILLTVFAPFFP